jgi:hypothetical protein
MSRQILFVPGRKRLSIRLIAGLAEVLIGKILWLRELELNRGRAHLLTRQARFTTTGMPASRQFTASLICCSQIEAAVFQTAGLS